jgi:hypothetical protein
MKTANIKLDNITHKVQDAESKSREEDANRILQWVSAKSVRARHIAIVEHIQPETGLWLLKHDLFRSWVDGDDNVLWCPGIRKYIDHQRQKLK